MPQCSPEKLSCKESTLCVFLNNTEQLQDAARVRVIYQKSLYTEDGELHHIS